MIIGGESSALGFHQIHTFGFHQIHALEFHQIHAVGIHQETKERGKSSKEKSKKDKTGLVETLRYFFVFFFCAKVSKSKTHIFNEIVIQISVKICLLRRSYFHNKEFC